MNDFEAIYRAYFRDVFLFVRALSGDDRTAEDVTADTFLAAMSAIGGFRGECDIRVWLCGIAKNKYYSRLRRDGRAAPEPVSPELPADTDVEAAVVDKDTASRAHAALHALPEPYREVFTLRVFCELSFKQIGELFGKTDNWACVTFHRAKAKLREGMEDQ